MQIKAKYFVSITQYHRALADSAATKYGDALVRLQLAEAAAKEAHRIASNFNSAFLPQMSPNLPADSGQSLFELVKSQLALSTERRAEAQRDNDLIYNAVLPTAETLPSIDKTVVATAIPIQEVYSTPEVQKVIGPDLFSHLIPLSVHESASIYSEEKAKLVRSEVEKAEGSASEARSALDTLGVKAGLPRFRAMAEGSVAGEDEIPLDVRRYRDDIAVIEEREGVDTLLKRLGESKESARVELDSIGRDLDAESQDCEAMRVRYPRRQMAKYRRYGILRRVMCDCSFPMTWRMFSRRALEVPINAKACLIWIQTRTTQRRQRLRISWKKLTRGSDV